jgi:hypothetical protein
MNTIQVELLTKLPELKNMLLESIKLGRELSGAYYYTPDIIVNKLDLESETNLGTYNSVDSLNYKTNSNIMHLYFHTHIRINNPPSGNDVIDLLFKILNIKSEFGMVVEPSGIYLYTFRAKFIAEICVLMNSNKASVNSWKLEIIDKINKLANQYHQDPNLTDYLKKMFMLGIEIKFIEI